MVPKWRLNDVTKAGGLSAKSTSQLERRRGFRTPGFTPGGVVSPPEAFLPPCILEMAGRIYLNVLEALRTSELFFFFFYTTDIIVFISSYLSAR